MTKLVPIAAAAAVLLGGANAAHSQSAVFETEGFPIALHQAQVTGLGNIQERSPAATLTLGGMPASPHQMTVLMPHARMTHQQMAETLNAIGYSEVVFELPAAYGGTAMKNGVLIHFTVDSRTGTAR